MRLNKIKFESLRRAIGWHKPIDKLLPTDIDLLVDAYGSQVACSPSQSKLACIEAYETDLKQYKLIFLTAT